ncbi:probable LRR receptor-like serine/threonine-protein kinase [Tanacetum coccineum]
MSAKAVMNNAATEAAQSFTLSELQSATKNFEKKVRSGGFGTIYYRKLHDGKEIVVKLLENSNVTLLSRIHHRNLVQFLGFCQEEGKDILVYEFMHNGTLKEHLYGPLAREREIKWL